MRHGTLAFLLLGSILEAIRPGKNSSTSPKVASLEEKKRNKCKKCKKCSSDSFAVLGFATSIICPDRQTFEDHTLKMEPSIIVHWGRPCLANGGSQIKFQREREGGRGVISNPKFILSLL